MTYEIIDNFLPRSVFKPVKNVLISEEFPWMYRELKGDADSKIKKYHRFEHIVYMQNVPVSPFFDELIEIINNIDCKSLLNMSCNMFTNAKELIEMKNNPIYPFPNTKAILYLTNNDGYTILKDDIKIENIENRLLLFDGSKSYVENNCTNTMRKINISFNFI
jgi:hypothetical protein